MEALVRIVDDEETVRNSELFIFKLAGIPAAAYSSAEEFLAKDDLTVPGCIILDLRMLEMSGLQLQRCLQEKGSDLPIIFLTRDRGCSCNGSKKRRSRFSSKTG